MKRKKWSVTAWAAGSLAWIIILNSAWLPMPIARADETSVQELAEQILTAADVHGGLIVHVNCGDGRLTAALRQNGSFVVQGLTADADQVQRARQTVRSLGLYGDVSIRPFDGERLPYIDNLVNMVVVSGEEGEALGVGCQVSGEEILRVLCPGGVAVRVPPGTRNLTPELLCRKPWPDNIDQWTHWLHGPDGNAVANDRVVGPPQSVQWVAPPQWQRHHEASPSLSAIVSSGGRIFAIINEAPAGIDRLPDQWALVARDAFSGKFLWKRPIEQWGWSQWGDHSYGDGRWNHPTHIAERLVAVDGRVYTTLGFNAPLSALDAATGETLMTYPETEFTDEILCDRGTLILSRNTAAQGPGRIAVKPPVGKEIMAIKAGTGEVLWRSGDFAGMASKADAIERVTHLSLVSGDDRVFCVEDDAVIGLDRQTGRRLWRVDRGERPRPVTYGSYYFTNLCSMVYHDEVLLFMEPDPTVAKQAWNDPVGAKLFGISAATGEILWTRDCGLWGHYNQGDIFVIDGVVWVHDGQSYALLGLDPQSGEIQRTIPTQTAMDQGHHHRCYRNKATPQYIITGRRGVEFIDMESEGNTRHHWTRGTCRYGVLPCNGLLYVPPHPCVCYITAKLNGFWALKSGRGGEGESGRVEELKSGKVEELKSGGVETGQAFGLVDFRPSAIDSAAEWPTYRQNPARTGCADTELGSELRVAWTAEIGGRLTSPVIADGRVLLAARDAHTVYALGADDGRVLWSYTAGGRIDTPPTLAGPLALFGSADGWVYCLRAADGELVWRRRAAMADVQMMANDQLESPWPVHGSVLVQDGVAYFAAGRSSFLDGGITVSAVRPETGELLTQNTIYSADPETGDMVEARLPYDMPPDDLGALPDILVGDGESLFMRHLKFQPQDLAYSSSALTTAAKRSEFPAVGGQIMSVAGMLDDNWFNQTYWTVDGRAHSKLLVCDDQTAYGVRPFGTSARHSRAIFTPATKGYALVASNRPRHDIKWSVQVPVRIQAMVLGGDHLFAAGSPDVVDPEDPWAAIEGRGGGVLQAVATADGSTIARYQTNSPPVFDGMAVAGGRLFVSTLDGNVVCFEGPTGPAASARR